jgi:tetratricopeptide (TPR) repeat protein
MNLALTPEVILKTVAMAAGAVWALRRITARTVADGWVRHLLMASLVVRIVLGVLAFCASYADWPVLTQLQTAPGFWAFALDSAVYDHYAGRIMNSWRFSEHLPNPELGVEYFILIATLYRLIHPHPLIPVIFNTFLALVAAVFVYRIADRLFNRRAAAVASLLTAWWPSSLVWSSQLLKDALSWTLIMGSLLAVIELIDRLEHGRSSPWRRAALWAGTGVLTLVMIRLRFYLGWALSIGALAAVAPAIGGVVRRGLPRRAVALALVPVSLFVLTLIGRNMQPLELFCAVHSGRAGLFVFAGVIATLVLLLCGTRVFGRLFRSRLVHATAAAVLIVLALMQLSNSLPMTASQWRLRWAMQTLEAGQFSRAARLFGRSAGRTPNGRAASLGQGLALVERGTYSKAIEAYALYLGRASDAEHSRPIVRRLTAHLFLLAGNTEYIARHFDDAARLYQSAADLYPTWEGLINLALAQSHVHRHEHVMAALAQAEAIKPERGPLIGQLRTLAIAADQQDRGVPSARPLPIPIRHAELVSLARQAFATRTPPPTLADAVRSVRLPSFGDQLLNTSREATPQALAYIRRTFVATGGYSLLDPTATISSLSKLARYLPRAVTIGLFAPFPWEWLETRGSTGVMRALGSLDMVLWYLLIPSLLAGAWTVVRRGRPAEYLLLAFGVTALLPIALVVANLGTLYRLRLQALLPLVIVAASADPIGRWRRWLRRAQQGIAGLRSARLAPAPVAATAAPARGAPLARPAPEPAGEAS